MTDDELCRNRWVRSFIFYLREIRSDLSVFGLKPASDTVIWLCSPNILEHCGTSGAVLGGFATCQFVGNRSPAERLGLSMSWTPGTTQLGVPEACASISTGALRGRRDFLRNFPPLR